MRRSFWLIGFAGWLLLSGACRKNVSGPSEIDTSNLVSVTTNPPDGSYLGQVTSISISFSQPVRGMDTLANIGLSGSGVGTSQIVGINPTGENTYTVSFSGAATNGGFQVKLRNIHNAENRSLTRDTLFYNIDTTNPLVSSAPAINSLVKSLPSIDLTYSKAVTGANIAANYSLSGAGAGSLTVSSVQPLGGNRYRVFFSGTLGTSGFSVFIQNVQDTEARPLSGPTLNFVADVSGPTMTAQPVSGSTTAQPAQVDITFSEQVQNALLPASYSLTGGGRGSLVVSGVTQLTTYKYRLALSGSAANGLLSIQPAGVMDMAGNFATTSISYTIDLSGPTKTPSPVAGTTLANLVQFDVTYSEPVIGANIPTNYILTGIGAGNLSSLSVTALGGNTYRVMLSGNAASGAINVQIIGVTDVTGNPLTAPGFSYAIDASPVYVSSTSPAAGAATVLVSAAIQLMFSETIQCGLVNSANAYIQGPVAATIGCAGSTITLTPVAKLNPGTQYSVTVVNIQDQLGNTMVNPYTFTFTTAASSQSGTSGSDEGTSVTTDIAGNIYVGGFSNSNLDGQTNAGLNDMSLTKYNSSGQKQWTRLWGGAFHDETHHLVADLHGGIYAAGFKGLTASTRNAVILKYDGNGVLLWAKELGAQTWEANGLGIDANEYLYTVGAAAGGPSVFRAKLDILGQVQWLVTETLPGYHNIRNMAVRADGVFYYTGNGNAWGSGAPACFIRQCDAYGNALNNVYLSGGNSVYCNGIKIAPDNTVVAAGWSSTTLTGTTHLGGNDVLVVKYSATLTNQWSRQLGTSSHEEANDLVIDSNGDIYFAGFGQASFYGNPTYGSFDVLLGKINSSGSLLWSRQVGSTGFDAPVGVALGLDNILTLTGYTSGALDAQNYLGGNDAFLIRYDNQGNKK